MQGSDFVWKYYLYTLLSILTIYIKMNTNIQGNDSGSTTNTIPTSSILCPEDTLQVVNRMEIISHAAAQSYCSIMKDPSLAQSLTNPKNQPRTKKAKQVYTILLLFVMELEKIVVAYNPLIRSNDGQVEDQQNGYQFMRDFVTMSEDFEEYVQQFVGRKTEKGYQVTMQQLVQIRQLVNAELASIYTKIEEVINWVLTFIMVKQYHLPNSLTPRPGPTLIKQQIDQLTAMFSIFTLQRKKQSLDNQHNYYYLKLLKNKQKLKLDQAFIVKWVTLKKQFMEGVRDKGGDFMRLRVEEWERQIQKRNRRKLNGIKLEQRLEGMGKGKGDEIVVIEEVCEEERDKTSQMGEEKERTEKRDQGCLRQFRVQMGQQIPKTHKKQPQLMRPSIDQTPHHSPMSSISKDDNKSQPQIELNPQIQPQIHTQLQPQTQPQPYPQSQPQLQPQLQPQPQHQGKPFHPDRKLMRVIAVIQMMKQIYDVTDLTNALANAKIIVNSQTIFVKSFIRKLIQVAKFRNYRYNSQYYGDQFRYFSRYNKDADNLLVHKRTTLQKISQNSLKNDTSNHKNKNSPKYSKLCFPSKLESYFALRSQQQKFQTALLNSYKKHFQQESSHNHNKIRFRSVLSYLFENETDNPEPVEKIVEETGVRSQRLKITAAMAGQAVEYHCGEGVFVTERALYRS